MTEALRLERPVFRMRFLDSDGDSYQTTVSTTGHPTAALTETLKGEVNEGTILFKNNALRIAALLGEVTDSTLVSMELISSSMVELES